MTTTKNEKQKITIQEPEVSEDERELKQYIKKCIENELHSITKSRLGKTDEKKLKYLLL